MGRSLIVLSILLAGCSAMFEKCDYYQDMKMGQTYYVYSPNYPEKYSPGMSCRFYAVSPPETNIEFSCENISIPPSQDCYYDRLSVSKKGLLDLSDAVNYCGSGSVQMRSEENRMNIVAVASHMSPGGTFLCSIKAVPKKSECECGWKNQQRIVGGTETGVNEYPMMAGVVDGVQRELFCGATIISPKFAVTAAHCLIMKKPYNTALLVGDHDISTGHETNSSRLYIIDKFIIHPEYSTVTHVNDIGLVRVERKIEFSQKVGPVCLPFLNKGYSFIGESVVALGWGAFRFGGVTSDKLMKVYLDVVSNKECRKSYQNKVTNDQMCTYRENKDACQNDSGGPLLWSDSVSGRVKLLGIISYGIQCATEHPSVNTRVTSYVDWIRSRTGTKIGITETTCDERDKKPKYEKPSEDRDRKPGQKPIVRTDDEVRKPEEVKDKTPNWTETRVILEGKPYQIDKEPIKQAEKTPEEKEPRVTKSEKDQSYGRETQFPARCESTKRAANGLRSMGRTKFIKFVKFVGLRLEGEF